MQKKELGAKGEEIAEKYLTSCRYKILEKNYRCGRLGEIDIIASDRETIVFVEVKTRKTSEFGTPEESVNFRKQEKIKKLAYYYINRKRIKDVDVRFDVISIFIDKENNPEIKLIKNAF